MSQNFLITLPNIYKNNTSYMSIIKLLREGEIKVINTEEKSKMSIVELIKSISWGGILLCVMSFFVGRVCVFDTFYTLGVAYVGAVFFNKQVRRWSGVFAILGIVSMGGVDFNTLKYILGIVILMILREGMTLLKGRFNMRNQLLLTGVSMLSINIISLILQEFTVYHWVVALLESTVVIGMMSVINLAADIIYSKKRTELTEYELASVAFLMALFLCGVIDFYVVMPVLQKVYIKDVLVFIILIGMTYLGGMASGVVVSIIISTVLVVIGYMPPAFVGIFVFAAMIGGLFSHLERIGIIFAMTLGLLLGFALFNDKIIDMPILGAYLFASVITMILPKSYFGMANWFGYGIEVDEQHHLLNVQAIITEKLKRFSSAFEGLGKKFEEIPLKNMDLDVKVMNQIIEDTGESICKDCSMCHFCWEDYIKETYKSSYQMIDVIEKKGQIVVGDIPPYFVKACINPESFAYALEMKMDVFKQACRWQKNFEESRMLLAQEFKGISESVEKLSKNIEEDFYFNKEDERKIKEALLSYGIRSKDVMVLENNGRKYEIHVYCSYKGESDYKERIIEATQKALGLNLEVKKYEYFIEEKYCYFEIGVKKQFGVTVGAQNKAKDGVCGDVYSFMELSDGKYMIGLADGMGSGVAARKESELTMELLEDFMEAGFQSEIALKMINSALVLRSDVECYTTMDMALIDQYTGVVHFKKMGASTSFIVRGDDIITVKASSLPIGILTNVDIVSCNKQLKDGDLLIMVSDGVVEDTENMTERETTFKHFILEAKSSSPDYMAKFLLNKTMNLLGGKEGDDMTIVVARIWKK